MLTRDDIIKLSRESGMAFHFGIPHEAVITQLGRFAELVSALAQKEAPTLHNGHDAKHWNTLAVMRFKDIQELEHKLEDLQKEAQQEPVGEVIHVGVIRWSSSYPAVGTKLYTTPTNHTAVLRQCLEALDDERYVSKYSHIVDAIAAIRELGVK